MTTKSELVAELSKKQTLLSDRELVRALNVLLDHVGQTLDKGERVEIRGFGSFSLRYWGPRHARNPVTGESWRTPPVNAVHFKPGKELRDRVNDSRSQFAEIEQTDMTEEESIA